MPTYYDGTKLLSLLDSKGEKPEIFICTSNRTAGKTTYFSRLCVNAFLKKREKFALLYRYNIELENCADTFFKDIRELFFNGYLMRAEKREKGLYYELFIIPPNDTEGKGIACGYALSLNNSDKYKRRSHLFSDIKRIFFDEFQSETNDYAPSETTKFQSIHTTIARGQGEQTRYVPVYMVSNPISLINPYYVDMNISTRLKSNTHFLRGDGFVLEQGHNESACKAQKESGFNRAFAGTKYTDYSAQGTYLNDNTSFVEKPQGRGYYLGTIKYNGVEFGIRQYEEAGVIYCDDRPDITYKYKISVTTDDHNVNYVMLKVNDAFIQNMRWFFEHGCFRFKDLRCKEAILKLISY